MPDPVEQENQHVLSPGNGSAANEPFRVLLEEHLRLRQEVEGLREQTQSKEQKEPEPAEKQDQEEPKPPLRERGRAWARRHPAALGLIVIGVLAVIVAGFFFWRYLQSYVSTDDAQVDGHIYQVTSRISGTVVGVYTENNQSVQKGQTVVDLDPRDYRAALAQAQANLAQAEANLSAQTPNVPITETVQSTTVSTARLDIANALAALMAARQSYESAQAESRQAEATAANAAAEEVRYRNLVVKDEVSREQYDQKATAAKAQQEMVASRRAAAEAARRMVDQRQAALDQARDRAREVEANRPREVSIQRSAVATRRASAQAARAQVEQALLNLSYCKILAPVSGIVGNRTVQAGEHLAPGQELFAITAIEDLWVTANFKETEIQNMHPGQSVKIHVDALDQDFDGYLENMPGATGAIYSLLPPENATGNYVKIVQRLPVRIRFRPGQSNAGRLRPGMSVEPKVWLR